MWSSRMIKRVGLFGVNVESDSGQWVGWTVDGGDETPRSFVCETLIEGEKSELCDTRALLLLGCTDM
jgi:hypothetical protein